MSAEVIFEMCGCGASIRTVSNSVAVQWRREHRCSKPVPPGPCWEASNAVMPTGVERSLCELLAGHAGAHVADGGRHVWGHARWTADPTRPAHHHPAASTEESTK